MTKQEKIEKWSEKWSEMYTKQLQTPKFLKSGTKALIDFEYPPEEAEVEGRFGKRKVFIVFSREHGRIYVTPMQFLKICRLANGDFSGAKGALTVEL